MKSLAEVLTKSSRSEELYTSDQKHNQRRAQKGYYTRGENTFDFINLIKNWENIVGGVLAQNSIPLKIRKKTLFINTKHPIFAQEMGFISPKIIEKLKEHYPSLTHIDKIKFFHNEFITDFNQINLKSEQNKIKKKKLHPYSPEFKRKQQEACELFDEIEDADVKKALKEFYLNN